jgi:riboflavin kinase/FMN adenylyltransferase
MNKWHRGLVTTGNKFGTALGFPTLNIANPEVLQENKQGVYASLIKIENKIYQGILFYGPRLILNETKVILEIFVFDFNQQIYNQSVSFKLVKYIRPARNFPDIKSFQKQVTIDCKKAKKVLNRAKSPEG